jgi:hypothetical protein
VTWIAFKNSFSCQISATKYLLFISTDFLQSCNDQNLCHLDRVTRLGEFSPIGWLFTLGRFLQITRVALINCATFFFGKCYVLILKKTGWTIFCAIIFTKRVWSLCSTIYYFLLLGIPSNSHLFLFCFRHKEIISFSQIFVITALQAGWPDDFVKKIVQNVAHPIFCQS